MRYEVINSGQIEALDNGKIKYVEYGNTIDELVENVRHENNGMDEWITRYEGKTTGKHYTVHYIEDKREYMITFYEG